MTDWRQLGAQALPALLLLFLMFAASQLNLPYLGRSLPIMPALAAVYYWSLFRPSSLPILLLAPFGLLHDALYGLPLGSSILLFLAIRIMSSWLRGRVMFEQFVLVWAMFSPMMIVLLVGLCLLQGWAEGVAAMRLLSAYDMPFFLSWLSYPLFHLMLNWCYHQLPKRI